MSDAPQTPLALFLAEKDVLCPNPKCGFSLRGLKDAKCPECGEPLNLMVRPRERFSFAPWSVVVATVSLAAALALHMYIESTLARDFQSKQPGPQNWALWQVRGRFSMPACVLIGLILTLVPYFLARRRGKFRALGLMAMPLAIGVIMVAAYSVWRSKQYIDDFGIDFW